MKNLILVIFFTLSSSLIFANITTNNENLLSIDYLSLEEVQLTQDFSNEYVFEYANPWCKALGGIVEALLSETDLEGATIENVVDAVISVCNELTAAP